MDREESTGNKRYIRETLIYIYIYIMGERKREKWIVNHNEKIISNRITNQYQNVM